MLLLHRPEIHLHRSVSRLVPRDDGSAGSGSGAFDLPAQGRGDPAGDESRGNPVAPSLPDVIDPDLGDAAQKTAPIHRGEELRDGLAPRPEPRPLDVGETQPVVRDLQQARHAPKRAVRLLEPRRVDHEAVTYLLRVEQLLLSNRRRAEPPEID